MMETKLCRHCNTVKPLNELTTDKSKGVLRYGKCKDCKAKYMHEYFQREDVKERENKKRRTDLKYIQKRRDREKRYSLAGRKKYRSKYNPEKRRINYKKLRESNPKIKLHDAVRARMRHDLSRGYAGTTSNEILENILHYDIDTLKKHLEKQFKPGMTWDDYGISGWHIDHKIPVAAFNFETPNDIDFKKCWALKNLQPMWAKDNCSKGARISKHFQPSLLLQCG